MFLRYSYSLGLILPLLASDTPVLALDVLRGVQRSPVELRVETVGADVMLVWCGIRTKMALYSFMLGTR